MDTKKFDRLAEQDTMSSRALKVLEQISENHYSLKKTGSDS